MGNNNWQWMEFHIEGQWSMDGYKLGNIPDENCPCGVGWIWINDQTAECYEGSTGLTARSCTPSCTNGDAAYRECLDFGGDCDPYDGDCSCSNSLPLICACDSTSKDCRVGEGAPCNVDSDCQDGLSCSSNVSGIS